MVYCATIFAGGMLQHSQSLWDYFVWWHTSVWGYETTLKATHPWGSVWWTWPFMNRPLLMMRDTNPNGSQDVINAIGNPLLWYASGVAVLLSIGEIIADLWRRRPVLDNPTVPLLLGWGTFLFGWIPVTRVLFIYHYLPSYGFALMLLVYWLLRLWKVRPWLVILFVLVALALTCFFYPELVGWIPLTPHELQMRVWATGWI